VGWVWTAVSVWVLLAVPVAVLLGRVIRRADREELEVSADVLDGVPLPRPASPPSGSGTP
jgi:hypothetical protein